MSETTIIKKSLLEKLDKYAQNNGYSGITVQLEKSANANLDGGFLYTAHKKRVYDIYALIFDESQDILLEVDFGGIRFGHKYFSQDSQLILAKIFLDSKPKLTRKKKRLWYAPFFYRLLETRTWTAPDGTTFTSNAYEREGKDIKPSGELDAFIAAWRKVVK